jgi:hypothetical protein
VTITKGINNFKTTKLAVAGVAFASQQLRGDKFCFLTMQILLLCRPFLQICNLPIGVICRANAECMFPPGKVSFINVRNQVVLELVQ